MANRKLPARVYQKHGAYYYVTLPERKWVRLGKTEAEMYAALAKIKDLDSGRGTMLEYFIRYEEEIIPTKAPRTQEDNRSEMKNLKRAFGKMLPSNIKPKHIYAYMDARGVASKTRANREKSLLSNVFCHMIRWGIVETNPCKVVKNFSEKSRDRYVEDWEYQAVLKLASPVLAAAMEIAAITGMRQGDILKLKYMDLTDTGIPLTQNKTGKKQIFEWTPALKTAIQTAKKQKRHADSVVYIIANERGQPYTSSGFKSNWQRLMNKAIETGAIKDRFTFHDLRAKAGSDAEHNAQELLGHASAATTKKVYLRKPSKVRPIR
ncbi:MAG: tyrosine-type recombinase/integrase [Methylomicrobium sp.]|nr:tyrosine-type recombinase/integrase [Methylomicrobium sp.]